MKYGILKLKYNFWNKILNNYFVRSNHEYVISQAHIRKKPAFRPVSSTIQIICQVQMSLNCYPNQKLQNNVNLKHTVLNILSKASLSLISTL